MLKNPPDESLKIATKRAAGASGLFPNFLGKR